MESKLDYKIVIEENGSVVYSANLSYNNLSYLVSNYGDTGENNDFFSLVARHSSAAVRQSVASKDSLSEEVFNVLVDDSSVSVLRSLVSAEPFKEYATDEIIERLVKIDVEIAVAIAEQWDSFKQANPTRTCAMLMQLSDPSVLEALARSDRLPKKLLKQLLNHPDPAVVETARSSLSG